MGNLAGNFAAILILVAFIAIIIWWRKPPKYITRLLDIRNRLMPERNQPEEPDKYDRKLQRDTFVIVNNQIDLINAELSLDGNTDKVLNRSTLELAALLRTAYQTAVDNKNKLAKQLTESQSQFTNIGAELAVLIPYIEALEKGHIDNNITLPPRPTFNKGDDAQ